MQKKGFILIVVLIVAVFIGVGYYLNDFSDKYTGPPALIVSEEVGDLGLIKPDKEQTHVFTLRNEGGETLIIENVQAPCGCTATLLSSEEILPGGTAQLEVTFNPRGYQGEVTQSVYIYSNDPEIDRKKIAITADIEHIPAPEARLSINQWELGLLSKGDSVSLSLIVSNQGDLEMAIESINIPGYITYEPKNLELPKTLTNEESVELEFTFNSSEHEIGMVREYIRITTTDPRKKNLTLRVDGYVKEKENNISILPLEYIPIMVNHQTQMYEGKIIISNNNEKAIQLMSVESSVDYLEPISQEMILRPGEEREVIIKINSEDIADLYIGEKIQEYIYLNIALPVNISPEP